MRHKKAHKRLGRTTSHRKALFRNMLSALVTRDRIETTLSKARELRPLADKLITLAKEGNVYARRRAYQLLQNKDVVQKLFTTLVGRFGERIGGYTRILKLGFRHGDSAPMAVLEYLTAEIKKAAGTSKPKEVKEKKEKKEKKVKSKK